MEVFVAFIHEIKARDAAAQDGNEPGEELLSKLGKRCSALQLAHDLSGAGLDPALFFHCRRSVLEDVDGAGQTAGLIRGLYEWDRLDVVTCGNGFHRCL
jgi:hypothetical protein